jgi:hypothetical protein
MRTELQHKLINKYPTLFGLEGKSFFRHGGIDCGDGWYKLLDKTLFLIDFYAKNPEPEKERFYQIKTWYNKIFWNNLLFHVVKLFPEKIYRIFFKYLSAEPRYVMPKAPLKVNILQIKEKFAGLRLYVDSGEPYIDGVIRLAESFSYGVCEKCGTNEGVSQNKEGWNKTLCKKCRKVIDKKVNKQ